MQESAVECKRMQEITAKPEEMLKKTVSVELSSCEYVVKNDIVELMYNCITLRPPPSILEDLDSR